MLRGAVHHNANSRMDISCPIACEMRYMLRTNLSSPYKIRNDTGPPNEIYTDRRIRYHNDSNSQNMVVVFTFGS